MEIKLSKPIAISVEECFSQSKTGNPRLCEDLIHIDKNFIAVIDGATSKTDTQWNGKTSGQVAIEIISSSLGQLPSESSARQTIDSLTLAIRGFYRKHDFLHVVKLDPKQRLSATLVIFSIVRQEIWLVGDCQCLLGNHRISNPSKVEQILANVRALFLELELLNGTKPEQLSRKDIGREFILPLLERQYMFQNNPTAGEFWYPAIDGFPVPDEGITIRAIPNGVDSIVLATDGYPLLHATLEESEAALKQILESDPLLIRDHKATKGLVDGNVSFDDRAFVKVKLYW
jgi:glycerophosphoryl diester phosphodiesterase